MKNILHDVINALLADKQDEASAALSEFFASKTKMLLNEQEAYDVFLDGKKIDTVFQNSSKDTVADVKKSLVDHDGYDSGIVVKKAKNKKKKLKESDESVLTEDAYFDRLVSNVVDNFTTDAILATTDDDLSDPEALLNYVKSSEFGNNVYKYVVGRFGTGSLGDAALRNLTKKALTFIRRGLVEQLGVKGKRKAPRSYGGGEDRPGPNFEWRSDDTRERDGPQYDPDGRY